MRAGQVVGPDDVRLHCEAQGEGPPIVFVHELAATLRCFDPQVRALRAGHLCVAFNARDYPPSDVPGAEGNYSEDAAAADILAVLDAEGFCRAHLVGVSMGAASALRVALQHPDRVRSLVLASIGSGSDAPPEAMRAGLTAVAAQAEREGMSVMVEVFGRMPNRSRLRERRPDGYAMYEAAVRSLSPQGLANTIRGVQMRRPPIYALREALAAMRVPCLILLGEEDAGCARPSAFLAETIPGARLERIPEAGHALNLESPERFNALVRDFVAGC